jgi:hypothetical protein
MHLHATGEEHLQMLRASFAQHCPHCHAQKIRGYPLCAACMNVVPLSARGELARLDDVADGFSRAMFYLANGYRYEPKPGRIRRWLAAAHRVATGVRRAISFHRLASGLRNDGPLSGVPDVPRESC